MALYLLGRTAIVGETRQGLSKLKSTDGKPMHRRQKRPITDVDQIV
jgi:hypothetical protein